MSKDGTASFVSPRDEDLSAVLAAYFEAVDRGSPPDRAALFTQHPHLAERLRTFFAAHDRLDRLAEPIRTQSQAEATVLAYDLLEEINRGGMGMVWRCRDRALDRNLAVKVLLDQFRDQPDMVRRFIEEARITGQLQHPFIVPVHQLGILPDGRPYFAMKLVEGRTFAELLRERSTPQQDLPRHLKVFEQICQTIAYAHSQGVIHRDLKPANVMVGAFGEVQVMDWGLAKFLVPPAQEMAGPEVGRDTSAPPDPYLGVHQTQAGAILGTYAYMPPEQAAGRSDQVSRRSDVFGLGAILCEILTGAPPYAGDHTTVRAQARAGAMEPAYRRLVACGADGQLLDLARTCLAFDPEERPADGAAVADAMVRYAAATQDRLRAAEIARATAETEAAAERQRSLLAEAKALAEEKRGRAERRRRRATVLLGLTLLLVLAAGAGFGLWYQNEQSARQAELASRRSLTERDVSAALAEVRLRRDEGLKLADDTQRWQLTLAGAWDALKRAENALALGEATEATVAEVAQARTTLDQDERDRKFFATLEARWLEASTLSHEDVRAPRSAGFLLKPFQDYGLDLEKGDPKDIAALVRAHPHRQRLVDEIGLIARLQAFYGGKRPRRTQQLNFKGVNVMTPDWTKAERLRHILDAIDDDPAALGTRWRAARIKPDLPALIALAQSIERQALSPRGANVLAHDLVGLQAFEEASNLLRAVHDRHPTDFYLNQVLGVVAMSGYVTGHKDGATEAIRYLTAALAARGPNPATYILLSTVFQAQGKKDEALRTAHAAVAADLKSASAYHHLGSLYFSQKKWEEALQAYHQAAALDPVSPLPYDSLGQTYAALKKTDEAIRHYHIALEREPTFAGSHLNLGNSLGDKNDLDGAIEHYQKALDLFPNYAMAHHNLGAALAQKNKLLAAIASVRLALDCDPNYVQAHYTLGRLLLVHHKDVEGAIQCHQKVIDLHPQLAQSHFQMADLLLGLGRTAQAETSLRTVININPRHPEAQARLGFALASRGDWDGAIIAYRTALKEKQTHSQKAALHDHLGLALFSKGEFAESVQQHRQALALDDLGGKVHYNLGVAQMAVGDLEEAAASLHSAVRRDPRTALYHHRLGKVLLRLRDLEGAFFPAQKAVELAPRWAEAYHLVAEILWDKGEFTEGLAMVRKGQEQAPPTDPGHAILRVDHQLGQQFLKGEEMLPAVLRGEAKAADATEQVTLAMICGVKQRRYAAATRLFAQAFADSPHLGETVSGGVRFRAACCAARAGTGDAEAEANLDDAVCQRLRRQALDWLRADLDTWKSLVRFAPPADQGLARFYVRQYLKEPDLERVRNPDLLLQLPTQERQAWTQFWADAAAFVNKTPPKSREGPDLAELRKLAAFPSVSLGFDVKFQSNMRDPQGRPIDPRQKIAELTRKLTGGPGDGELYLEMAGYHGDLKEKDKIQEVAQKAAAVLRPFQKATDPQEADRFVGYVRAQMLLEPEQWREQEQGVRQATTWAPKNWQAWQLLGGCCLYHARRTVLNGRRPAEGKVDEAVEALLAGAVPPAIVTEVEKLLEEARSCYDRARDLAPTAELQWENRLGYLLQELDWINALRVARGKRPLAPGPNAAPKELERRGFTGGKFSLEELPDLLQECREAAERCPNHMGLQTMGMMPMITTFKARLMENNNLKDKKTSVLTAADAQLVQELVERIEKIARQASPEGARYCDRVLGVLHFQLALFDDPSMRWKKAEFHIRRIVDADPKDQDALDVLEFLLTEQGRASAALEVARQRLSALPTGRNHYLLGRCLEYCGQDAEAEKAVEAALKLHPQDPYCLAGRAVLWLRRADQPAALTQAGKCLDQARAVLRPHDRKELVEDIDFAAAIYQALMGHRVLARLGLESMVSSHPHDRRYAAALEALGP